jgi:hypothetical protein
MAARYKHFAVAVALPPALESGVPPGGKTDPCPGRYNNWRVRLEPGVGPGGKMPPATAGETPAATKTPLRPGGGN